MTNKKIKLYLSQIGEGGLQEKVDKELEKVFDNILDPNTETKTARKLTIPGQTYFDEKAVLRSDIGEPIENLEKGVNEDVIDFNKQKKAGK